MGVSPVMGAARYPLWNAVSGTLLDRYPVGMAKPVMAEGRYPMGMAKPVSPESPESRGQSCLFPPRPRLATQVPVV
jgi:hypothetical protein